jgi:hypothetical protein
MSEMKEHQKKAFDFTNDLVKQIITLAVAIITLGAGNLDGLAASNHPCILGAAFIFYAISIIFGLFSLMFLSGHLDLNNTNKYIEQANKAIIDKQPAGTPLEQIAGLQQAATVDTLSVYAPKIKNTMKVQVGAFGLAILSTIIFAIMGLSNIKPDGNKKVYFFQQVGPQDSTVRAGVQGDSIYLNLHPTPPQPARSNRSGNHVQDSAK